jgi:indolepyruvate decarboxylase
VDLGPFKKPPTKFKAYNELPRWNYVKLAEAMGGLGIPAETMGEIRAALKTAKLRKDALTVIAVKIPSNDLPPPIERLATDTGYPRYPDPAQAAAYHLALLLALIERSRD